MQAHPVTGRDLYEALHLDNTTERNDMGWYVASGRVRIDYEKAAQRLNVQLGLIAPAHRSYLFALDTVTVTLVDDLAGLITCIDHHIEPYTRFEIYLIENGKEVGYGWYELAYDKSVITWECSGTAYGLSKLLFEQLACRALPLGGQV